MKQFIGNRKTKESQSLDLMPNGSLSGQKRGVCPERNRREITPLLNTFLKSLLKKIKRDLRAIKPHQVILFGSNAYGNPSWDSDIDLVVILNEEWVPKSYKEKMDQILKVRKVLRQVNETVGLDLLVFSKPEWGKFIQSKSSFSKALSTRGIPLL